MPTGSQWPCESLGHPSACIVCVCLCMCARTCACVDTYVCVLQFNTNRRTKKKPVYVISTLKRPVPLRHFLYTGNSKQTSDQLFEVVTHDNHFVTEG